MASSVANLSVLLTAKTGQFGAQMNAARRPLMRLQSAARTVQRGFRIAFSVVLARGFIGMLKSAVGRARELGVQIDAISRKRIHGLVRSYQAFTHVLVRLGVKIVSAVAPAVSKLIDRLTAAAMWLERKLTPAMLHNIWTVAKWSAALALAAVAVKTVIAIAGLWAMRLKAVAIAQALVLSLSGPAGWAALAVGAAAFGVALYGINTAFKDMEKGAGAAGDEIDSLKAKMRGLTQVKVGRMGIDFAPISTVRPMSDAGRALAGQESAAAAAIESLRRDAAAREERQRDERNRRYLTATPGGFLF